MAQRPIDEKLVVMKLDNSDFKKKAAETTSIFGKLKSVFKRSGDNNLDNITKELGKVSKAAQSVDMTTMARSVDMVANRFSTLGVIATTALTNITNKAVNAGMALQHSLTTAQVADGFKEYELKMGSIQTMLSNTEWEGTSLDDVKAVLEELNQYADRTIYDFGQMTQSIGKWTAAGVGLKDSATAIKGMGNLAASAGADVNQLNSAMYQMSQAMSAGRFGAIDWISLDNAGMGGKKTKDALLETAKEMGKVVDLSSGFKDSLQDGWLTAEVFLATMKKFGEDESMTAAAQSVRTFTGMMDSIKEGIGSGWAETWELIFGDFEQATAFWTAMKDLIEGFFQKGTDARNNFIRGMINSGAVEQFGMVLYNVLSPIVGIFLAIKSAFDEAFPPVQSTGLVAFLKTLQQITSGLELNGTALEMIRSVFLGLFSIVNIGVEAFKVLVDSLIWFGQGLGGIAVGVLTLVASLAKIPIAIYNYVQASGMADKVTEKMRYILDGLGTAVDMVGLAFKDMASIVDQVFTALSSGDVSSGVLSEDSMLINGLVKMREVFSDFFGFVGSFDFAAIGGGITAFFTGIGDTFQWVIDKFNAVVNFFKGFFPMIADNQGWILAGGGLAATAAIIWKVYESFKTVMDIGSNFGETLEGVSDALGAFTLGIHAKSLLMISVAIGLLAVSLAHLSKLDGKQIATSLTAVVVSMGALIGALAIINKFDLSGGTGAILAIIGMATAMAIMSSAVVKMGEMPITEASKGVLAITALLGALAGAMVLMSKYGGMFTASAGQLVAVAAAIGVLVYSINLMTDMNPTELIKGIGTIGILLLELGLFIKLASSRTSTLAAGAAGLIATAGAVIIMVQAIKQIAKIEPDNIQKGLLTIGAILTAIGIFTIAVKETQLMALGAGLIFMSLAINALIIPIMALGNAKLETLAIGLGAIGVALAAFALSSKFMTATIPAAIAIGLLAVALNLLIVPIMAIGQLSWDKILAGVGGLALALLAFGAVASILGIASPALVLFSVAVGTLGIGFLALGSGMLLLGKGLVLISATTVASVAIMVSAFGAFLTGAMALVPMAADLFMKVALAVSNVMVKMAPQIGDAVGKILVIIMDKINEYTPQVLDLIGKLLINILEKLEEYIPLAIEVIGRGLITILENLGIFAVNAVTTIMDILLALINTITIYIPLFIDAGTGLILALLTGIISQVPIIIDGVSMAVIDMINAMADTIDENGDLFINAIMRLMAEVIELVVTAGLTMVQALFDWIPGISEATAEIGDAVSKYLEENFKAFELAEDKGKDFSKGLEGSTGILESSGKLLADAGVTGLESVDTLSSGRYFVDGFINGVYNGETDAYNAAWNMADAAHRAVNDRLDINSPSEELTTSGEETSQGFANGIANKQESVMSALFGWWDGLKKTTESVNKEASKQGANIGKSMSSGVSKGVAKESKKGANKAKTNAKKTAKDIAREAMSAYKEKLDELDFQLEIGKIDSDKHIEGIKKLGKEYAKYPRIVNEVNKELKKIEDDARRKSFNDSKEFIDHKLYYNKMSLKDELKAWERLQETYKKGTDERKEADREVYRLKKELIEEEARLVREGFDKSRKWIDGQKQYNKMSLKAELDAWGRVQSKYKKGTEERKEADLEVYRLKKEMYQQMTDLNDEYFEKVKETNQKEIDGVRDLNKEYDDALASKQNSIRSGLGGMTSEFKLDEEITADKLLGNAHSQLSGITKWSEQLKTLAATGIDEGLLAQLREMGPSAASEVNALTQMTSEELAEYSKVWGLTNEMARIEAVGELEWLRRDIDDEIGKLQEESRAQLDVYKEEWLKKMREIRTGVPDEFGGLDASMTTIGANAMKGLMEGLSKMEGSLLDNAKSIANSVRNTINSVLSAGSDVAGKLSNELFNAIDNLDLDTDIQIRVQMEADTGGLDEFRDGEFKMRATGLVPDTRYSNQLADGITQPALGVTDPNRDTSKSDASKAQDRELVEAVKDLAQRPQVTQLYVDGQKMAEVVSVHQNKTGAIDSLRMG